MSWSKIAPPELTANRWQVPKMSVKTVAGELVLALHLPGALRARLGWAADHDQFAVEAGGGEHAGQYRVTCATPAGAFPMRRYPRGGAVHVFCPLPAGAPRAPAKAKRVPYEIDGEALILSLPEAWRQQGAPVRPGPGDAARPGPRDVTAEIMGDPPRHRAGR